MKEETKTSLGQLRDLPKPTFTSAIRNERQQKLPQCIAHRGYSAVYPENTLAAFRAAVDVGAHAVEMDILATKDDVVVISHDPTLKSQFGRPETIAACNWCDLEDLKTVLSPHETIPRLADVLQWLKQPGVEDVWIMLEIKPCTDPERIMRLANTTINSISPSLKIRPWNERIVICVLPASYLILAAEYLPGFPVAHIGFWRPYVRRLLDVPNLSFSLASPLLILPGGQSLLAKAQTTYSRQVYTWVVNDEATMKWCIRRELDGVLCDDPKKFLDVCRSFDQMSAEPWFPLLWRTYWKSLVELWAMARRAWSKRKVLAIPKNAP